MMNKALETIKKYDMFEKNSKIIIALSGGADSMALTFFLNSIKDDYELKLTAAHVNHGLRGEEADRDEGFVGKFCESIGMPLEILHADVGNEAKRTGEGIEECGRRIRYEFFDRLANNNSYIATAHTLSDSMETILINIARGAGLKGLCGIPPKRGNIIRPLIECTRAETEKYCKDNKLDYVTDSTNLSREYTRNRIRLDVIPELYRINPSFDESVQRMINSVSEDENCLSNLSHEAVRSSKSGDGYDVGKLLSYEKAVRNRALSAIIEEKSGVVPEYKHIEAVDELLKTTGSIQVCGGLIVRTRKNRLEFPEEIRYYDEDWKFPLCFGTMELPFGVLNVSLISKNDFRLNSKKGIDIYLDYGKIKSDIVIRSRREGDRYRPFGRSGSKTLKKLFNEAGIPPEKRGEIPVVCDEEGIVGIVGFPPDERAAVGEYTEKVLHIEIGGSKLG